MMCVLDRGGLRVNDMDLCKAIWVMCTSDYKLVHLP
jgi:hypothetical protein